MKKSSGPFKPERFNAPECVIINSSSSGFAVWHTPPQQIKQLFTENLRIPSGEAHIPAMVWKAGKNSMQIFAVADADFTEKNLLCHGPFLMFALTAGFVWST